MLTAPDWSRAVFVRHPESRLLAAYLDKRRMMASDASRSYISMVCRKQPSDFAHFVSMTRYCKELKILNQD